MNARLLLTLAAAACVSTKATRLDPTLTLARVCPAAVRLYTSPAAVGAPYTEVAVLRSSGDDELTSAEGIAKSQRAKAAKLGATGVILGEVKDPSTGAKVAKAIFHTGTHRTGSAVAIYVPTDTARVREACRE